MALFRNPKFDDLEREYFPGKNCNVDEHIFTLTVEKIMPFPTETLGYDWVVTLSDGYKFRTHMGPCNLNLSSTRLEHIISELKTADRYTNDYLANAINHEIDKIFRTLP